MNNQNYNTIFIKKEDWEKVRDQYPKHTQDLVDAQFKKAKKEKPVQDDSGMVIVKPENWETAEQRNKMSITDGIIFGKQVEMYSPYGISEAVKDEEKKGSVIL
jgi:threonine synthase